MPLRDMQYPRAPEILKSFEDSSWYEIGKESAEAYLTRSRWLYRRVESIEFVGRRSLRRHVSIDFEGPKLPSLKGRGPRGGRLVPVSVFSKWPPLMEFDLRGPDDQPISLYKRSTNKELDFGLLMGMIERLNVKLDMASREELALLVGLNAPNNEHVAAIMSRFHHLLMAVPPDQKAEEDVETHRKYVADTANLAAQLANSSVLWAPLVVKEGCDSIVKFAYLDKHEPQYGLLRRSLVAFSWQDRVLHIPLPHGGQHTRYHLDIRRLRAGVEFLRLRTFAFPAMPPKRVDDEGPQDRREDPVGNAPFAEIVDRRAHVYHPARSAPSHRAYMELVVAATREGFISQCATVAIALAVLMTVSFVELRAAVEGFDGFVVLLAAIPLVLGYVLVRSEDALEREGIIGVRGLSILSGVIPIVGGLMLVFAHAVPSAQVPHPNLKLAEALWSGLMLVSWMIVMGLLWSVGMAVKPHNVLRRSRIGNIAAGSGSLAFVALVAANLIIQQPFKTTDLASFVSDHRARVIAAGALTLVAAGALHGFIEAIRRLAHPRRDRYTRSQKDASTVADRAAAVIVIGAGELWILLMSAAALLTLWEATTLPGANSPTRAVELADRLMNIALVPAIVLMFVATIWLGYRRRRLRGDWQQILAGLLAAAVAFALRALSILIPGFESVSPRVAWFGFAGWIACVVVTAQRPVPAGSKAERRTH